MALHDDLQNLFCVSWRLSSDATLRAQLQSLSVSLQQPQAIKTLRMLAALPPCVHTLTLTPPYEFLQIP